VAREFHPDDPVHQEYLRQQYRLHLKNNISDFNTFMEAQLAWEETMAETLVAALAASAPEEQIVVLIGKGHISDRVGVPRLVRERLEQPGLSIAPVPLDYPGRTADPGIADYVWITARPELLHRVRLGVVFRHAGSPTGGLEILGVLPDSPADKAGIKKGDILYRVDGTAVASLEEVHRAISGRPVHELTLKRGGRNITVSVTLSP
jgi:membrane-associated protease RseP (regulator of RpoE activity)